MDAKHPSETHGGLVMPPTPMAENQESSLIDLENAFQITFCQNKIVPSLGKKITILQESFVNI